MTGVKDIPILMQREMVLATLAGLKTETRRIFKLFPDNRYPDGYDASRITTIGPPSTDAGSELAKVGWTPIIPAGEWPTPRKCPYGTEGDLLWVREDHYRFGHWEPEIGNRERTRTGRQRWKFVADSYDAAFEAPAEFRKGRHSKDPHTSAWHKRLGRFMPKALARTWLRRTFTRVERVQEITDEGAFAEGIGTTRQRDSTWYPGKAREMFADLWKSINGPESWERNDWVWVVGFERVNQ